MTEKQEKRLAYTLGVIIGLQFVILWRIGL